MKSTVNTIEVFGFEVLSSTEMNEIKGGVEPRPITKDKDVFDIDED